MQRLQQDNVDLSTLFSAFAQAKPIAVIRTPEDLAEDQWLKQRWGKFTASQIHRLMTNARSKEGLSAGAMTYVREIAAEQLSEFRRSEFVSDAIEWGKDHELEAIEAFTESTNIAVVNTGDEQRFLLSPCENWGGTPDGITADAGVEVKCPDSKNHLLYLGVTNASSLKQIEPKYYWQIQACIELAQASQWYFITYDPRFYAEHLRLHWCEIERVDDDIEAMLSRIDAAIAERDRLIQRLI